MNAELKASHSSFRVHHSSLSYASVVNGPFPRPAFALLFLLLLSNIAHAIMPFDVYRERVRQATLALDSLASSNEEDDEAARAARIASTLRTVREIVPKEEMVEWNNSTLRVNNSWLDDELNNYEKLLASDPERADRLRARITERLYAIGERLAEVEGEKTDGAARKDEEKARLVAILRRAEYQQKASEGSALARLWQRFLKWLRDLLPDAKPLPPGDARSFSRIAQAIVFALALGVVAIVLWKFGPRLFGRNRKRRIEKREARVVLGERLEPDQTASDLLSEAEALALKGDLRAAIRKGYIALLCELGDRKIIRLAQHKTNRDYLRAVEEIKPLHDEMEELTKSFENHWYGRTPATANDWLAFRTRYQKAVTSDK